MSEVISHNWAVFAIVLVLVIIAAWWLLAASRRTRIERSAGEEGLPARRNQALIDAPPASAQVDLPPPTPEGLAGVGAAAASPFRRRGKQVPVTPAAAATVPEGVDSAARYMSKDGTGLVAREQDGVTIVTRQAAE